MRKSIRQLRRAVGRQIPENYKAALRSAVRLIKPVANPTIPAEELKIFELLKDDMNVVFDVGAREDLTFYRIKSDCTYHLFEPSAKAIQELKKQIAELINPRITLNEFGLSDKQEDNCIYYEESQSFVINPFHTSTDKGHRYSLRTLDDYVAEHNISHIDFLKIDAEGLDYKILLGGLDTIKTKVTYIQFEFWDGVQKFVDMLGSVFDLYLMMEPKLLEAILEDAREQMTEHQKKSKLQ